MDYNCLDFSNHIHVTGEARSGTTLMKNLFRCYNGTLVVAAESSPNLLNAFTGTKEERDFILSQKHLRVVTKLPYSCSKCTPFTTENYPNLTNVVYVVRDPRDIVTSLHGGLRPDVKGPYSWWRREELFNQYPKTIDSLPVYFLKVKYEDVILNSARVQEYLSSAFNLDIVVPFSSWHLLEDNEGVFSKAMHGIRPLSPESISRWKTSIYADEINSLVSVNSFLQEWLIKWGYS